VLSKGMSWTGLGPLLGGHPCAICLDVIGGVLARRFSVTGKFLADVICFNGPIPDSQRARCAMIPSPWLEERSLVGALVALTRKYRVCRFFRRPEIQPNGRTERPYGRDENYGGYRGALSFSPFSTPVQLRAGS